MLVKYVDGTVKKSSKAGSEAEIDEKLTRAVFVFQYLDDKDLFQKLYSKMLAKRSGKLPLPARSPCALLRSFFF